MKALLIGKRARVLSKLKDVLLRHGWAVAIDDNLEDGHLTKLDVSDVDVVAFGRALSQEQKSSLFKSYQSMNPDIKSVEGYGPIPDLLAYQIMSVHSPSKDFIIEGSAVKALQAVTVTMKLYGLNWLYITKTKRIVLPMSADQVVDLAKLPSGFQFVAVTSVNGQYATLKLDRD